MKTSFLQALFFVASTISFCWGQNKQWESMYSFYNTSTAIASNQNIIVAAENALFIYDTTQETTEIITTVEGLSGDTISTLAAFDSFIIAGHENGLMARINTDTKEVQLDNAIERNQNLAADKKRIHHIEVVGNKAYVATGFGIVVLNPMTLEFGDTYYFGPVGARFGVFQATVFEGKLYAATAQGLYSSSIDNPQLLNTTSWDVVSSGNWKALWEEDGELFGAKDEGSSITVFEIGSSVMQKATFTGTLRAITPYENGTVITASNRVYDVSNTFEKKATIADNIEGTKQNSFTFALRVNNDIWIGTSSNGLIRYTPDQNSFFVSPQGPLSNSIFDIETLPNELWIAHGDYNLFYNPYPLEKHGLSHFFDGKWTNINNEALFGAESLVRVIQHPTVIGTQYACSYHGGIVLLEDNIPVELWDQLNSGLESLSFVGPDYVSIRVRDALVDDRDNLWSLTAFVQKGLKKRNPSGQWTSYDLSEVVLDYTDESGYSNMVLFNNKILFFGGVKSGLIGVDISQSPPKMKRLMGSDAGLPGDDVRSIRLDKDNRLWVGTREGIAVLYAPNRFFEDDAKLRAIVVEDDGNLRELLSGQMITDIEVDGNNQKWISTSSSGVFLINPNGTEIVRHFTKENSPLPTSSVKTIGVDNTTGKVYLGTLKGMVVFQGDAYAEAKALSEIKVFPNPVRPHFTGNLVVRGLRQGTRVKITDIAGNLVYDTTSQGGSISWDLRTFTGQRVHSGVYLIFATSKDGIDSAVDKVMIIN